jgi:hypothetical protein
MPWSSPTGYPFTSASIGVRAPDSSGVFGLFDNDGWIFIATSDDIQRSLFLCRQKSREYFLPNEPTGYVFELVSKAASSARRDHLVFEFLPLRNNLPETVPQKPDSRDRSDISLAG